MFSRIETLAPKKLTGNRILMSYANNKTYDLWKGFMSRRSAIRNSTGTHLFSLQVYDSSFDFKVFDPHAVFEKWAAVEVTGFDDIPENMEPFLLPGGLYAVFIHTGAAATAGKTFTWIFGTWLPQSGYQLDHRPHFEILGEKYKNDDPASEEEVWIPIRPDTNEARKDV
jgi:AraC family transcriptional regulator